MFIEFDNMLINAAYIFEIRKRQMGDSWEVCAFSRYDNYFESYDDEEWAETRYKQLCEKLNVK